MRGHLALGGLRGAGHQQSHRLDAELSPRLRRRQGARGQHGDAIAEGEQFFQFL
jgi:hypothetical protein